MPDQLIIELPGDNNQYVVLETDVLIDFGNGQGPKCGVVRIKDGSLEITGPGRARLRAAVQDPGGLIPAALELKGASGAELAVLRAHDSPVPDSAPLLLQGQPALIRMSDDKGHGHVELDGLRGDLRLGGVAARGDAMLFALGQDPAVTSRATVRLAGGDAATGGSMSLKTGAGDERIALEAHGARIWIGGNGDDGDICVFAAGETQTRDAGRATIHLNGSAGDIILRNADCAEEFDTSTPAAEPGTVMVIADDESLAPCSRAYDRRVAGVVSGAGDFRPAIVLDRRQQCEPRLPIALVGKVYCRVDADVDAIEIGDLLTSSARPGHAMKASDPTRTPGAVIGKALRPLAAGCGMIPILVALQ
ncbi:MAG: hypothetical protein ABI862_04030 [Ilumatobacteraceae bacterium]